MANISMESIARWIMERAGGATVRDVCAKFGLTKKEASRALANIRKTVRYKTVWVPGNGHPPNSHACVPGTLKVLEVKKAKHHKTAWGAVVAVRCSHSEGADNVLHFDTVYDADLIGGFCNVSIYKCLSKQLSAHAGYFWLTKEEYDRLLNDPHDPYTENFYSN